MSNQTPQQIIEMIREDGAETDQDILYALEDGAALVALGLTDDDQEAVECAHAMLTEANARLIAAAPDMLAALQALIGDDMPPAGEPGHIDYGEAVRMAREAISKATAK